MKGIWQLNAPNAMKVFMWRACNNALPMKANMAKRKIVLDPLCSICGLEVETMGHILWSCLVARDTWGMCGRKLQKS